MCKVENGDGAQYALRLSKVEKFTLRVAAGVITVGTVAAMSALAVTWRMLPVIQRDVLYLQKDVSSIDFSDRYRATDAAHDRQSQVATDERQDTMLGDLTGLIYDHDMRQDRVSEVMVRLTVIAEKHEEEIDDLQDRVELTGPSR